MSLMCRASMATPTLFKQFIFPLLTDLLEHIHVKCHVDLQRYKDAVRCGAVGMEVPGNCQIQQSQTLEEHSFKNALTFVVPKIKNPMTETR